MIAFYGVSNGWGKLARIAAVAQHIADSTVVYMLDGSSNATPLDWHGVDWYAVSCGSPNCGGVSPQQFARVIEVDDPLVMVMDTTPYGAMAGELRSWIKGRQATRNFFVARRSPTLDSVGFDVEDFAQAFKTEGGPYPGIDAPILPFDPEHILTRDVARSELNLNDRPTVFLVSSPYTQPNIAEVTRRLCQQHGVDLLEWTGYPLMPYLMAADLVVGMAGSLALEVRAVDVPHQLAAAIAAPDQQARANATPSSLAAAIASLELAPDHLVSYRNDARQVAAAIAGEDRLRELVIPNPPPIVG
jgi:hypothetical protein